MTEKIADQNGSSSNNRQNKKFHDIINSLEQFIAGGGGGLCLVLAGHPMDTIKVRIQTMPTPLPGQKPQFKGMFDCIGKTFRHEGIRGFYRGMTAPLIAAVPINAVCFFGFGLGVKMQTGSVTASHELTFEKAFVAGMVSGACCAVINTPTERIKCLMQIEQGNKQNSRYKSFSHCTRLVYQSGGVRSLYTGFAATITRDVPGSGAYFAVYEYLKHNGSWLFNTNNQSIITLLAGGFAGIGFWSVSIPADVIKSRIQTAPEGKYSGFFNAIDYVYQRRGLRGFYTGAGPVFVRAFPANAACFFGYELTLKLLHILIKLD